MFGLATCRRQDGHLVSNGFVDLSAKVRCPILRRCPEEINMTMGEQAGKNSQLGSSWPEESEGTEMEELWEA